MASIVKAVSDSPSASGIIITLHPLVIMNISDHYTRITVQRQTDMPDQSPSVQLVMGALLGTQNGREIEIFNSFEIPCSAVDGSYVMNKAYFISKRDQFNQVFPTYDVLGWYSTGLAPTSTELNLHQQMSELNEGLLYLQLNPTAIVTSKELPINVYESVIDLVNGQAQTFFTKSDYKVETADAERIAVDHVAHASNSGQGSTTINQLTSQRNAVQMLHTRIKLLKQYVTDVKSGVIPVDHVVLRQISSLVRRLPVIETPEFQEELMIEYSDSLLISYIATLTKGANILNDTIDAFNFAGFNGNRRSVKGRRGSAGMGTGHFA
ncbi:maintenance of mitochondrial structure and function-domain-containing protein [Polychytrium aggregatum]|uniref:maintenance of mitochondrial structure and function-domain-containing protein n=1 Tax=Polychytrium aggregatum TaxID=110093 RepID=UPI0022FE0364|nr:maintenance of mitochondrial structure and function-domain-containing protein [Polychytrium aggregatum]KAI9209276.1 maintenance of mitochondrial structure and function-domain-containing protein [Polychytrium aggregatum]